MSWGFIDKLRAPNIEVWHILGNQSNHIFLSYEYYVTYNTLWFIFPELPNRAVNPIKKVIFKELYDYINRNSS